jgi:cobalt-precorrin 5A hydrolase
MREARRPWAIYAITKHGVDIGKRLAAGLPGADLYVSEKLRSLAPAGAKPLTLPFSPLIAENFRDYDCHIFLVSVGAVVRMIAPHLVSKKVDPAVLCVDDASRFVVSLLSGHVGRGNEFTARVATLIDATPVITTASDVRGTLTVDILGRELGWTLADLDRNVTRGCAAVVNETKVCFVQEAGEPSWWPLDMPLPPGVTYVTSLDAASPTEHEILLVASDRLIERTHPQHYDNAVIYRPKSLVLGLGCDRGTPPLLVERGVRRLLDEAGLSLASVKAIATIDLKADEPAFLELAERHGWPLEIYPAAALDAAEGIENPSEVVRRHVGTRAVAEPAALLAAGAKRLLVAKRKYSEPDCEQSMTMAVARLPHPSRHQALAPETRHA